MQLSPPDRWPLENWSHNPRHHFRPRPPRALALEHYWATCYILLRLPLTSSVVFVTALGLWWCWWLWPTIVDTVFLLWTSLYNSPVTCHPNPPYKPSSCRIRGLSFNRIIISASSTGSARIGNSGWQWLSCSIHFIKHIHGRSEEGWGGEVRCPSFSNDDL